MTSRCISGDPLNPAGLKNPWQSFTADGRFRIARKEDFSIPDYPITKRIDEWIAELRKNGVTNPQHEKSLEKGVRDQYSARTVCPVMGAGDFNHDGNWYDLAVIVVDTTADASTKFGLVIFNKQKSEDALFTPCWVYKNRDLSKTVLNAIRDDLSVTELKEDGTMVTCFVKWDTKQDQYICSGND